MLITAPCIAMLNKLKMVDPCAAFYHFLVVLCDAAAKPVLGALLSMPVPVIFTARGDFELQGSFLITRGHDSVNRFSWPENDALCMPFCVSICFLYFPLS